MTWEWDRDMWSAEGCAWPGCGVKALEHPRTGARLIKDCFCAIHCYRVSPIMQALRFMDALATPTRCAEHGCKNRRVSTGLCGQCLKKLDERRRLGKKVSAGLIVAGGAGWDRGNDYLTPAKCRWCTNWYKTRPFEGLCRRNAPPHPKTNSLDWCGDYVYRRPA